MGATRNRVTDAINSIEAEVLLRLFLLVGFLISETLHPFIRVIHKEEFWLLDNPRIPSYYPTWLLTSSALLVPFITIYLLSYCRSNKEEAVKGWLGFTFSGLFTAVLTNLVKNVVGRPRPDFMNRCFPDGIPESPFGDDGITLLCSGIPEVIKEGRKSFPSGHSSIMFSTIGFLSLYLAKKLNVYGPSSRREAWRMILASLPFLLCLFVALSRTCDYHHHWQDVTVGSLLGFSIAYASFRQYLCPSTEDNYSPLLSFTRNFNNNRKTSIAAEGLCDLIQREIESKEMKNDALVTI